MRVIDLPRAGGKSTTLARMMVDNPNLVYVAPTVQQAQLIGWETARKIDPEISKDRFISVAQLERYRGTNVEFIVDEADGVLNALFGGEVRTLAHTAS